MNILTITANGATLENSKTVKDVSLDKASEYIYSAILKDKNLWIEFINNGSDKFYEMMYMMNPIVSRALSSTKNQMHTRIVAYVDKMPYFQWLKEDPKRHAYEQMQYSAKEDADIRANACAIMYANPALKNLFDKVGYDNMVDIIKAYAKEYDLDFSDIEETNPLVHTRFHNCGEDVDITSSQFRCRHRYNANATMEQLASAVATINYFDKNLNELKDVIYSSWNLESDETVVKITEYDIQIGRVNLEPDRNLDSSLYIFSKSVRLIHKDTLLQYIKENDFPCLVITE